MNNCMYVLEAQKSDTFMNFILIASGNRYPTGVQLFGKRDNCYGTKHNDYEGGYYEFNDIGAFGSEVYAA